MFLATPASPEVKFLRVHTSKKTKLPAKHDGVQHYGRRNWQKLVETVNNTLAAVRPSKSWKDVHFPLAIFHTYNGLCIILKNIFHQKSANP